MSGRFVVSWCLWTLAAACAEEPTGGAGGGARERWSETQDGRAYARPAVLGDLVYFGTGDGYVVARDRRTGAERWRGRVAVGGGVDGGTLVAGAGVVVAPVVGHVMGLDAATGRERWRYAPPPDVPYGGPQALPGQVFSARLDADAEAVYVPAWGASVSALDLRTGVARWVWQPGRAAGDTAAGRFRSGGEGVRVSGDTVFASVWHYLDANGLRSEPWLVALDRATGRELWRVVLPSHTGGVITTGAPAVWRDLVVLATRGGHVWAVSRTTQQVAWHYTPQTRWATLSGAEVHGDAVYADGGDEWLYALDAATGAVRWKANPGNGATRDLLVTERRVYYPTGGRLYVYDRHTGRQVATLGVRRAGDIFETAPMAADGQVFVLTTAAAWSFDEP